MPAGRPWDSNWIFVPQKTAEDLEGWVWHSVKCGWEYSRLREGRPGGCCRRPGRRPGGLAEGTGEEGTDTSGVRAVGWVRFGDGLLEAREQKELLTP